MPTGKAGIGAAALTQAGNGHQPAADLRHATTAFPCHATWVDRAARREADLDEARAALEEQFAEHGEPSAEDRAWAREALIAAGVGQPEPAEEVAARQEALARLDGINAGEEG